MTLTRTMRVRNAHVKSGDEESQWISFTDIMSGLLLVFILATVALMLQVATREAELKSAQQAYAAKVAEAEAQQRAFDAQIGTISEAEDIRAAILAETHARLQEAGVEVVVNSDTSVLSIPTEALGFASGSYAIDAQYAERAALIGRILSEVIGKDGRAEFLDTVFVEGHTDSEPFVGPSGMGNWGLSTFRAISLWNLWDESLPPAERLDSLTNAEGRPLFSVSGYADTRPAPDAPTGVIDFAGNRRIDIRITIVRPNSEELRQISDEFRATEPRE